MMVGIPLESGGTEVREIEPVEFRWDATSGKIHVHAATWIRGLPAYSEFEEALKTVPVESYGPFPVDEFPTPVRGAILAARARVEVSHKVRFPVRFTWLGPEVVTRQECEEVVR